MGRISKNSVVTSGMLTQEEVNELPDGATVIILWSGGNGPYEYKIGSHYSAKYTLDSVGSGRLNNLIDFVGKGRMNTKVWRVLDE